MSLNKQLISFEGEFFDMLNERSNVLKRQGVSNCIGTALFLVGELPRDEFIYGREHEEILRKLEAIPDPKQRQLSVQNFRVIIAGMKGKK